ncbi:AAA domain-containing protein [Bacillus sp. SG-1]|uniref:AAA domain-containing protein n=1 Tax=Bacillus sp. SG-1 TaxID=161544 RepID=UPI0001544354|nr:AAA domain-containing protein [Bacillus sp. SG-1]EDL65770.1 possible DNA helicase [Bacillus sp. SG-1]
MNATIRMIQQWKTALIAEIQKLKEFESRGIMVLRGQHLATSERGAVYWLVLAYPVSLFPGGAVIFDYGKKKVEGSVLSSEGVDVIVELDTDLGEEVGKGLLHNEPWDLLNKLIDRLEEIEESSVKLKIIDKVMDTGEKAYHPEGKAKSLVHEAVLRSKYNPVTYIWGPPGTGKTYTLARAAAYQYVNGKKILLLSHSNAAIDVLTLELNRFLQENEKWTSGEVIRYGFPEKEEVSSYPDLSVTKLAELADSSSGERKRKFEKKRMVLKKKLSAGFNSRESAQLTKIEIGLAKLREKLRKNEAQFVNDARVVATTLSKAATDPLIYQSQFDLVVIDEASMAYTPQIAFAATLGSRVIICGDFKQLPPIAVSRHGLVEKWLKQDIFHLSGITRSVENSLHHPHLMLLPVQRRMHPHISAFTNKYFYHSLVSDHPDVLKQRTSAANLLPFEGEAAFLLPVTDNLPWCQTDGGSRWNLMSSLISIQMMLAANESGMPTIGYVTPYRAQAKWMNRLLPIFLNHRDLVLTADIFASTVHKFQGSEKDMILFDLTDGSPQEKAGTLLTKRESGRLINVSVTRAKGKFILLGDHQFIKNHVHETKPVRKLIDYLEKKRHRHTEGPNSVFDRKFTKRLRWFRINNIEGLKKDIINAKKEIILSFEKTEDVSDTIWRALKAVEDEKTIIILCKQNRSIPLIKFQTDKREFIQPFIGFDKKVLWFGDFHPQNNEKTFPYIARVFSGKFFTAYDSYLT